MSEKNRPDTEIEIQRKGATTRRITVDKGGRAREGGQDVALADNQREVLKRTRAAQNLD